MINRIAGTALVLLLGIVPPASAMCDVGPVLCELFWSYEAVFDGTVRSIVQEEAKPGARWQGMQMPHRVVTFEVHRAWRGSPGREIRLVLPGGPNLIVGESLSVTQGTRYLIFASRFADGGPLSTSGCDPSGLIDAKQSTSVLEFLDSLARPARGGRVFGSLWDARAPAGGRSRGTFEVVLEGQGIRRVTTSARGSFAFNGLRPGTYRLFVKVPGWPNGRGQPMSVNLPDPHSCVKRDIELSEK